MGDTKGVPQIPPNQMTSNANVDVENRNRMVLVGELHWWTRDIEIESVVIQYGRVKEIKFFDEWESGKSKGYCKVEFYDSAAASACKDGMNGHIFNGRACVVEFATPQTIRQMEASYMNRIYGQAQPQPQPQLQGRNPVIDAAGRGNEANYSSGNFGRSRWNQAPNWGRGRGGMVNMNMMGNAAGVGGGTYRQGITGPSFGMMPPQGMYGGRGGFRGMVPPFQAVNSMGLPGVAPHVNPAFFGRGMNPNGMNMRMAGAHSGMWNDRNMGGWGGEGHGSYGRGMNPTGGMSMMGSGGMGGPHSGMWNAITNMGGWGGEELGRESSYGYGEASHEKDVRSSAPGKQHREEREHDRDSRRREEEKDRYRDKGQSSRSRSRPEDDHRSRSRDADHGKQRRMPSE